MDYLLYIFMHNWPKIAINIKASWFGIHKQKTATVLQGRCFLAFFDFGGKTLRKYYLYGERNLSGERIFLARKERKLSQGKLAELMHQHGVDIDRMAISEIENRTRTVTDYELMALSDIYGVSLAWLIGRE